MGAEGGMGLLWPPHFNHCIVCIRLKTQMPRAHYNTVNCGKTANCCLKKLSRPIAVFRYTTQKWASDFSRTTKARECPYVILLPFPVIGLL